MMDNDISLSAYTEGYDFKLQEKRKKKRLITLSVLSAIFVVTTLIFIVLYVYALQITNEKCTNSFNKSLEKNIELISYCQSNEFDYDRYYREIVGNLGSASGMLFLTDVNEVYKVSINNLYNLSIKLPSQFKLRMDEIKNGLVLILNGDHDKGYAMIDKVIAQSDKLDY